jgi:hypothetical protein
VLAIHKVSDVIDGGEFVVRSHPVAIPEGINAVGMHRITWPQMGPFIRHEVGALLGTASRNPLADQALVIQEARITCGVVSRRGGVEQTQTAFAQWN